MVMPTRFLEEAEFKELLAVEEGETIIIHKLTAQQFLPPQPVGEGWPEPEETRATNDSVRVMLLPVMEPRLYRDKRGVTFVVFPSFETLTYEAAQDMHPIKGAFAYRFAPYEWDGDPHTPLKDATYLFADSGVPDFELEDVLTH